MPNSQSHWGVWVILLAVLMLSAAEAGAYTSVSKRLDEAPEWYAGDEARRLAGNVMAWQTAEGGWPKNTETAQAGPPEGSTHAPTFDNASGFFEIQFLARVYGGTQDPAIRKSIERGIGYVLKGQYPNGGWPQAYPPPEGYKRHITFNDGTMARQMFLLRDVFTSETFAFLDDDLEAAARKAWDRGVDCILKCQVRVDGVPTVWCAQHDEKDFSAQPGRAFEPASLSGQESLAIMNVLMHVEDPSPEVIAAVDAAAAWFEKAKLEGIRIEDRPQDGTPKGFERFVVEDPAAAPMWARFYEIGTNRPIFVGRDGAVKYSLAEIDVERRTGYQWYGKWATTRLEKEYPAWKARIAAHSAEEP